MRLGPIDSDQYWFGSKRNTTTELIALRKEESSMRLALDLDLSQLSKAPFRPPGGGSRKGNAASSTSRPGKAPERKKPSKPKSKKTEDSSDKPKSKDKKSSKDSDKKSSDPKKRWKKKSKKE